MAFTEACPKDRPNGVHRKDNEKRVKKFFNEKGISQKTIPKIVSMGVHRRDIKM